MFLTWETLFAPVLLNTEIGYLGDIISFVNEGFGGKIETEIGAGARFPAKVPSKGFVNNPARMEMVAKDVSVLLTNY